MTTLLNAVLISLGVLVVVQTALVVRFAWRVMTHKPQTVEDSACPTAAVVLCLRGVDPTLSDCLQSLLRLDYPEYRLLIVVDHPDDPALDVVRQATAAHQDYERCEIQIEFLESASTDCSRKCSALVQAVKELQNAFEVIALIDADAQPHATWLRELVAPFRNNDVGATTGIRWYVPQRDSFGSMLRYIWNAAAIVQMQAYRIAWGGTLAFRTSVFSDGQILKKWSTAFCEDTMTTAVLKQQGMRLELVPSLVMVSQEKTTVRGFYNWMRRQLLTSRLYHPAWPLVASHCVSTTLLPLLCFSLTVWNLFSGEHWQAGCFALGFVVYELAAITLLTVIQFATSIAAGERAAAMRWFSPRRLPEFLSGLLSTQFWYGWSFPSAAFGRRFEWRGIEYQINPGREVEMLAYQKWKSSSLGEKDSENSL